MTKRRSNKGPPKIRKRKTSPRLRTLRSLFPDKTRTTLWRWRRAGVIGPPDALINGIPYYDESRFISQDQDEDDGAEVAGSV